MDMLDQGLDSSAAASHDKGQEADEVVELQDDDTSADEHTAVAIAAVQQAAFSDGHNIQYQFRTENNGGQVTYRVVQVTDGQLDGQGDTTGAVSVVSTAAFAGAQQAVAQAVIQNPFSNGGSPSTDAVSGEARFAYFPASTVGDTNGGQFYVMMTPQDVIPAGKQRTIAPRTHPTLQKWMETELLGTSGAEHNTTKWREEEETRLTTGSSSYRKIIPDCNTESSKTGAGVIDPLFSGSQQSIKAGSCPKPATTSASCGRPTSACRRPSKKPSGCRWGQRDAAPADRRAEEREHPPAGAAGAARHRGGGRGAEAVGRLRPALLVCESSDCQK
ncbi:unnamed protein product, partial [Ranitomeya imitator]